VTDGVYVAIGYDLANTILIQTTEGHVVVDVSMNPVIAERVRADLEAEVGKAPIHTIIYTHSHVVSETMWQDYWRHVTPHDAPTMMPPDEGSPCVLHGGRITWAAPGRGGRMGP
jgi:predicted metal-dependent RNase